MLSDEERELIEEIQKGNKIGIYELIRTFKREGIENFITVRRKYIDIMINLIEKQSKEIEEMKKQLDLGNECEIALNSKVMDLENADKKWEDKIKAKIEEMDIEIQCCEYADDDVEEYKQDMEKEKRRLLRDKVVLQSLLNEEK